MVIKDKDSLTFKAFCLSQGHSAISSILYTNESIQSDHSTESTVPACRFAKQSEYHAAHLLQPAPFVAHAGFPAIRGLSVQKTTAAFRRDAEDESAAQ